MTMNVVKMMGSEVMKGMDLYLRDEDVIARITGWEQIGGDVQLISWEGDGWVEETRRLVYDDDTVEVVVS